MFAHYLMCSFNQYFLSTHCVQGLMLSTVVEDTSGLSPAPQEHQLQGSEQSSLLPRVTVGMQAQS